MTALGNTGRRLVVEADGAARGNPGPASYGAVVRDAETGEVLAERADVLGRATNNVAEYSGLIAALEAAFALDPAAQVEVRMDSKLVIEQMAGRWSVKHPNLKPLALRARGLIPAYERVSWTWIPRAQNGYADRLANAALDGAPPPVRNAPTTPSLSVAQELPYAAPAGPLPKIIGWAQDLGTTTTMVLVRHGETEHTWQRRFSGGSSDPELSELGRRQAELTAAHLASRGGVDVVISSPLRRCLQTAEAAAGALGAEIVVAEDLRECSFGVWDGLTFAEVQDGWGEQLSAWLAHPSCAPPGGESLEQVAARVGAEQERLLARYGGDRVVVVAHVTPIRLMVLAALTASLNLVHRLQLAPASLSTVCWYADGNAALHGFNDTGHLGLFDRGDGE